MRKGVSEVLRVRNDLTEISRLQEVFAGLAEEWRLPSEIEFKISLALEEVLSNVLRHGCMPGAEHKIEVRLARDGEGIEFEVIDDGIAYDPLSRPDPDVTLPLDQRRPGGLGVFLVRKIADELRYERSEGRNHLFFRLDAVNVVVTNWNSTTLCTRNV